MIEIVFSESAAGSLKIAQTYGKGEYTPSAVSVGVIGNDDKDETKALIKQIQEEERERFEAAIPLGGNAADVFAFPLELSTTDISNINLSDKYQEALKKIDELLSVGEAIRIWYSECPDDMCGLYWFADVLSKFRERYDKVYVVKLPGLDNSGVHVSWGEIHPGEWHKFLSDQVEVNDNFLLYLKDEWCKLKEENAPLRAVINGRLCSVEEDFYDKFILKEIDKAEEEFVVPRIIGSVLSNYMFGISDTFIAKRIEEMTKHRMFEVVSVETEGLPWRYNKLKKI